MVTVLMFSAKYQLALPRYSHLLPKRSRRKVNIGDQSSGKKSHLFRGSRIFMGP
jgi:hypothetical protein